MQLPQGTYLQVHSVVGLSRFAGGKVSLVKLPTFSALWVEFSRREDEEAYEGLHLQVQGLCKCISWGRSSYGVGEGVPSVR